MRLLHPGQEKSHETKRFTDLTADGLTFDLQHVQTNVVTQPLKYIVARNVHQMNTHGPELA